MSAVQLRLGEPTDDDLLALIRADRDATTRLSQAGSPDRGWPRTACEAYWAAADALAGVLRHQFTADDRRRIGERMDELRMTLAPP